MLPPLSRFDAFVNCGPASNGRLALGFDAASSRRRPRRRPRRRLVTAFVTAFVTGTAATATATAAAAAAAAAATAGGIRNRGVIPVSL